MLASSQAVEPGCIFILQVIRQTGMVIHPATTLAVQRQVVRLLHRGQDTILIL